MTEELNPDVIELVGGPECGLLYHLPENHNSDGFYVPYERTDKKGKVYKFDALYLNRGDGHAQYKEG